MRNVRLVTIIVTVISFFGVIITALWPVVTSASRAHVSIVQSLETDNVTTTGTVVEVGTSSIGNGSSVVTYAYDVADFPRNGNPGSFEREQIIKPNQMSHFHTGMPVQVVYSRALKGESRLQGYDSGNLFLQQLLQSFKTLLFISIPIWLIGPFFRKFLKRHKPALAG